MLCVFLRGMGIVRATLTQDAKVDLQDHESCHEKECDLDVQTISQNKTSVMQSIVGARHSMVQ